MDIQKICATSSVDSSKNWLQKQRPSRRRQCHKLTEEHDLHIKSKFCSNYNIQYNHYEPITTLVTSYKSKNKGQHSDRNVQSITHQFSMLNSILLILITLLQLSIVIANSDENKPKLPICLRYQACAVEVNQFPLLSETVGEMIEIKEDPVTIEPDGSGDLDGSGLNLNNRGVELPTEEMHFPLYDEFVSEPTLFDYNADADVTLTQICQCPHNEDGSEPVDENGCTFEQVGNENTMQVDKTLRLAFCQPVTQLFKTKCIGRRSLFRIIGQVDVKAGESLTNVNDTAIFCRCDEPMQLKRITIEPWLLDQYAFSYRCTRP